MYVGCCGGEEEREVRCQPKLKPRLAGICSGGGDDDDSSGDGGGSGRRGAGRLPSNFFSATFGFPPAPYR